MRPDQVAQELRRIASKLDRSDNPDRKLVARDIQSVIRRVAYTYKFREEEEKEKIKEQEVQMTWNLYYGNIKKSVKEVKLPGQEEFSKRFKEFLFDQKYPDFVEYVDDDPEEFEDMEIGWNAQSIYNMMDQGYDYDMDVNLAERGIQVVVNIKSKMSDKFVDELKEFWQDKRTLGMIAEEFDDPDLKEVDICRDRGFWRH